MYFLIHVIEQIKQLLVDVNQSSLVDTNYNSNQYIVYTARQGRNSDNYKTIKT